MTDAGRILVVDDEAPVREVLSDYFVERRVRRLHGGGR
jgi:CheY-like chemotaxis protein